MTLPTIIVCPETGLYIIGECNFILRQILLFSAAAWYNKLNFCRGELVMAYKISEECISCGACESECPVSCISAGDNVYVVNAGECIDCGSCAAVCPVDAPKAE